MRIHEGSKKTLDLVVGRFGVEGQRNYHTFVRLSEESDTYVANNFMGISLYKDPKDFRNNEVARIQKDSLVEVSFNYPDSAFSIIKEQSGKWISNGVEADSASVQSFLNSLSFLNSTSFSEGEGLATPTLNVTFGFKSEPEIQLSAFQVAEGSFVISSSENGDEYFQDTALFEKVFKSPSDLLSPGE